MILDSVFFMTAISFSDVSILSVFIVKAVGSTFIAGLLQMCRVAGFFIPQLLSVNIGAVPSKKRVFLKWTTIGRLCLLFTVLTLFTVSDLPLIVASIFASFALFPLFDGFTVVPWLEYVTKSIPSTRRGTFFGVSQFIGAVGTIAGGFLVSAILTHPDLAFPRNYGYLFLIEVTMMLIGVVFILLLTETLDAEVEPGKTLLHRLREIPRVIRQDATIRRLMVIQILLSFHGLATPFYSVFMIARLGVDESLVGYFLIFQMMGRLAFSYVWARLGNHARNKEMIQYTGLLILGSLVVAVLAGTMPIEGSVVGVAVLVVFFLLGAAMGGMFFGFNNYVLAVQDPRRRPLLLGILNSLYVVSSVLPLLGGYLIESWAYETVFVAAIIPIGLGLMLTQPLQQRLHA
jgi:MFS family permease